MQKEIFDSQLRSYATVRQLEYIEAIEKHGSMRAAARKLNVGYTSVWNSISALKRKAVLKGHSPEHGLIHTVPDPLVLRGTSTLFNKDGEQVSQWIKTRVDDAAVERMIRAVVQGMADEVKPVKPVKAPRNVAEELLNLITITDGHIGAYAWHEEGGADWNLPIAEQTLCGGFIDLINRAPAAKVAVIAQLGDFLHFDGLAAVTPTHGHLLDSSGRFSEMVQVAIRVLRRMVAAALTKHEKVVLLIAEGNHDLASSVWLRQLFKALYENEPRVQLLDSEAPYYAYQWGRTMLGWHHGHLKKFESLPLVFASMFAKIWGETTHRFFHTGHLHHKLLKEFSGITGVQHPTLAARDSHSSRHAYDSLRDATCFTYHLEYGQVASTTVSSEMLTLH